MKWHRVGLRAGVLSIRALSDLVTRSSGMDHHVREIIQTVQETLHEGYLMLIYDAVLMPCKSIVTCKCCNCFQLVVKGRIHRMLHGAMSKDTSDTSACFDSWQSGVDI